MNTMTLTVQSVDAVATGVRQVVLAAPDGAELPAFTAGAHVELHLPGGLLRAYSLCNPPWERHRYVLGVLHAADSRGGSAAVHALQPGQVLRVGAPRNHFALLPAPHTVLLAGGIGITPLLAMAEVLEATGAAWELHHACRSADRAAFSPALAARLPAGRVHLHLGEGTTARLGLGARLRQVPAGSRVYACGPTGFMAALQAEAAAAGWPPDHFHTEAFGAAAPTVGDQPFTLRLSRSGRTVSVAADQTALQALLAAGLPVESSCEAGVCGSCLLPLLGGQADHRDSYLTPAEQAAQDRFAPCCSRARSAELLLDL
ncbi:PDR/VanB family oxidoreductase [Ideonella livida]|uniref:Oxidoreductase n=1 Tax=Ideonella livida TaxID=2707176 RepID=A0A7C9PI52_9BURK|nr:PDR/VanB family oxidoreductase [Ideonella livida]NDY91811.1 oxidoreductase [Ideonella livida]